MNIYGARYSIPPAVVPPMWTDIHKAGIVLVEWWPCRTRPLMIEATYPGGRVKMLRIENPEPGMRIDLRAEDGAIPDVLLYDADPTVAPLESYETRIVDFDSDEMIVSTHHDHTQLLPLGVARIVNGAAYGVHSTFVAWRSGLLEFVYECSAEPTALRLRVSGRMTGGLGKSYYHSFGAAYRTNSPDTLRGYLTAQPRIAADVTQGAYVIAGIPYRVEILHGAAAPLDIGLDVHITPHPFIS